MLERTLALEQSEKLPCIEILKYVYHLTFISFNLISKYLQLLRLLCFPVKHDKHPQVDSFLVNIYSLVFSPVFLYVIEVEWHEAITMWPYYKTLSLMVEDSALPTVSLAVVLRTEFVKSQIAALCSGSSKPSGLRPVSELGPRDRLGPVSCRTPESSPWLPTDRIQPLK